MSCVFYIIYLPVPDNKGFGTYIICFSCVYGIYIFSRIILFLYKNPRCQYLVSLPPGDAHVCICYDVLLSSPAVILKGLSVLFCVEDRPWLFFSDGDACLSSSSSEALSSRS